MVIYHLDGSHLSLRIPVNSQFLSSEAVASPDGAFVVLTTRSNPETPAGLVGVDLDGHELWRVDGEGLYSPALSADVRRLAFVDRRQLGIFDIATGELAKLRIEGESPAWSPRGDRLAYDDGENVFILNVADQATSLVGRGTKPSWAPDGKSLAVRNGRGTIHLIDLQTRERREFLNATLVTVPRWSPDGKWMKYTRAGGVPWWSLDRAADPQQVIVRDTSSGAEAAIGLFYKGTRGEDFTWIMNRELCGR